MDKLYIYDGVDSNAPEVSGSPFSGSTLPGEIVATNAQGALTFYFDSNVIYTDSGWKAEVFTTIIAGMDKNPTSAIREFALIGNYPNPFNPSTTIRYQLPTESAVEITVFNMLGQKLHTLYQGKQKAGSHSVMYSAPNLPSGVYFYRLKAGTFDQTKKMILLR